MSYLLISFFSHLSQIAFAGVKDCSGFHITLSLIKYDERFVILLHVGFQGTRISLDQVKRYFSLLLAIPSVFFFQDIAYENGRIILIFL